MAMFSESDYSDIANGIIKNYEENKNGSIRKISEKKNSFLNYNNSDFDDSMYLKKLSTSNENKLLTNIKDNYEDSSYNSLVDEFYNESKKKLHKDKKNSSNLSEGTFNNMLASKSHIDKKDEKKLLTKKKVIQRNNEILKKNPNRPLMPLLKKKYIIKKKDAKNKKREQVTHKSEWNSNQHDLDKYRLSKEEIEQKKNNLKSKNLDKVKVEYRKKLKQMREKNSLVTSKCKENNNYDEEGDHITTLSRKKKENKFYKNLVENVNKQQEIHTKNEVASNNKKNNLKYNNIKRRFNSSNMEEENTFIINNGNDASVPIDRRVNKNGDTSDYNSFDINSRKSASEDVKNSKKHIYKKINRKKEDNSNKTATTTTTTTNNNRIKLKKNKNINKYKSYNQRNLNKIGEGLSCRIDSDSYAGSILHTSDNKREFDDNCYFPRNKQFHYNKDFISFKKKKFNNLRNNRKEILSDFDEDNYFTTLTDFSSDKTTLDYFVEELKNHNENLCIDIDTNNIKMDVENYEIKKKIFEEKKYYPNIELKPLGEPISSNNSCSSNYDYEYIFDSDYSDQIIKLNDTFVQDDNMLKLKKIKIETFKNIKKIVEKIKNIDYENINIIQRNKKEIEKQDDYSYIKSQKEDSKLYNSDDEREHLKKKMNCYNRKIEKTEKKDYYEEMDEQVEKTKVYPLMELLFKEDDDDYYLKEESNGYYKVDENLILNETNNSCKEKNTSNSYILDNSNHSLLYHNRNSSNKNNASKRECIIIKKSNPSEKDEINNSLTFSSLKYSSNNIIYASPEYSYNLSKTDTIRNNIELEKSSYNYKSSIELMNNINSNTENTEKNTNCTSDNYKDYLKKNSDAHLIFSSAQHEKSNKCDSLKNTILNRNTKKSNRNNKEKNEDNTKKIDRKSSNLIKNETKSSFSKLSTNNNNTEWNGQKKGIEICEASNKKIMKCEEEAISNISKTSLRKKGKNNAFNKKKGNEVKNMNEIRNVNEIRSVKKIKNRKEMEHTEKYRNEDSDIIKNPKDTIGVTKNNVNKKAKKLVNENKDNKINNTKKEEKRKEDIYSSKEHRLINQKILNTSLNFDDTHNLSDDDKFIFNTYLNEENTKKKEANLSEIINNQVKAFEQIFL